MKKVVTRAKIRAQKRPQQVPERPRCVEHDKEMVYTPETVRWQCPTWGCSNVAFPRVEEDGRPIIGRGEIELVVYVDEDGKESPFLRATSNNVLLPLSGVVLDHYETRNGPPRVVYKIAVPQERVMKIDAYGNKKAYR